MGELRSLDIFPRVMEDYGVKTNTGALLTILSSLVIIYLSYGEVTDYLELDSKTEILVDPQLEGNLVIGIDISVMNLPCEFLSVDLMDATGKVTLHAERNLKLVTIDASGETTRDKGHEHANASSKHVQDMKRKITEAEKLREQDTKEDGTYCGRCHAAKSDDLLCCNSCTEVHAAYAARGLSVPKLDTTYQCVLDGVLEDLYHLGNVGCRIMGKLTVPKVAGSFHIAPGNVGPTRHGHAHDLNIMMGTFLNVTHTFNMLTFGDNVPGVMANVLGETTNVSDDPEWLDAFYYILKVVQTEFVDAQGDSIHTNQYSVTTHRSSSPVGMPFSKLPGVFVEYEFSPLHVRTTQTKKSVSRLLTSLCAIIGGIYTIASLIDALFYHGLNTLSGKRRIGKAA